MFLKILSALTVICCCGFPIHAGMSACAAEVARVNSNVDPGFILSHIDSLYRSKASSSEMEMTIKTPHWQRKLVLTVWTSGMDRTFIKISYPKKEKGIATLRDWQRNVELFAQSRQGHKNPAVDDDGVLDGVGFYERRSRQ